MSILTDEQDEQKAEEKKQRRRAGGSLNESTRLHRYSSFSSIDKAHI